MSDDDDSDDDFIDDRNADVLVDLKEGDLASLVDLLYSKERISQFVRDALADLLSERDKKNPRLVYRGRPHRPADQFGWLDKIQSAYEAVRDVQEKAKAEGRKLSVDEAIAIAATIPNNLGLYQSEHTIRSYRKKYLGILSMAEEFDERIKNEYDIFEP